MWQDDLKDKSVLIVLIFGFLGGLYNYYNYILTKPQYINPKPLRWRVFSFLGTLSVSVGAGYITFFYFIGKNEDIFITLAYSGFAAYLGIRIFFIIETLLYAKLNIRSEDVEKVYKSTKRN